MNNEQNEGMQIRTGLPRIKARNLGTGYHLMGVRDAEIMLGRISGQHLERRISSVTRSERNNYMSGVHKVSRKNNGCLKVISRTGGTAKADKKDAIFVIMFQSDFDDNRDRLTH